MQSCSLSLGRPALLAAALLLTSSSAWGQWAQPGAPMRAGSASDPGSPISPFLFGPPAYPFRATAPSSYRGVTLPDQQVGGPGGFYRGPSLDAASFPQPAGLTQALQTQPRLGSFVGFASLSSLSLADTAASLPGSKYRPAPDNRAYLALRVPPAAEVWFDGKKTRQTGVLRQYSTPPLTPGKKSSYEVLVRWKQDGKWREQKRQIEVEARDWLRFDFTQPAEEQQ